MREENLSAARETISDDWFGEPAGATIAARRPTKWREFQWLSERIDRLSSAISRTIGPTHDSRFLLLIGILIAAPFGVRFLDFVFGNVFDKQIMVFCPFLLGLIGFSTARAIISNISKRERIVLLIAAFASALCIMLQSDSPNFLEKYSTGRQSWSVVVPLTCVIATTGMSMAWLAVKRAFPKAFQDLLESRNAAVVGMFMVLGVLSVFASFTFQQSTEDITLPSYLPLTLKVVIFAALVFVFPVALICNARRSKLQYFFWALSIAFGVVMLPVAFSQFDYRLSTEFWTPAQAFGIGAWMALVGTQRSIMAPSRVEPLWRKATTGLFVFSALALIFYAKAENYERYLDFRQQFMSRENAECLRKISKVANVTTEQTRTLGVSNSIVIDCAKSVADRSSNQVLELWGTFDYMTLRNFGPHIKLSANSLSVGTLSIDNSTIDVEQLTGLVAGFMNISNSTITGNQSRALDVKSAGKLVFQNVTPGSIANVINSIINPAPICSVSISRPHFNQEDWDSLQKPVRVTINITDEDLPLETPFPPALRGNVSFYADLKNLATTADFIPFVIEFFQKDDNFASNCYLQTYDLDSAIDAAFFFPSSWSARQHENAHFQSLDGKGELDEKRLTELRLLITSQTSGEKLLSLPDCVIEKIDSNLLLSVEKISTVESWIALSNQIFDDLDSTKTVDLFAKVEGPLPTKEIYLGGESNFGFLSRMPDLEVLMVTTDFRSTFLFGPTPGTGTKPRVNMGVDDSPIVDVLENNKALKHVIINGTIPPSWLVSIAKNPSIKEVTVGDGPAAVIGVRKLKAALPNVKITCLPLISRKTLSSVEPFFHQAIEEIKKKYGVEEKK